jgi:ATP-dependent protease ClpP protease subunit
VERSGSVNRAEQIRRLKALEGRPAADSRPWYRIVNSGDDGPARVDVFDEIGGSWFSDGVTASGFTAALAAIPSSRAMEVHINSPGGDVFDGIAIYNAIAQRPGPVTTVVDGLAASAASFIAQAGKTRVVSPGSMMMIHDASGLCIGNAAEMRELADLLDQVSGNLADIYAAHAGKTATAWRDAMRAETWYKAQAALDAGLADQLAERPAPADATARFDLSVFAKAPAWLRNADAPEPYEGDSPCPTCKGKKTIRQGNMTCPDCKGTGKAPAEGDAEDRAPSRPRSAGGGPDDPPCKTCDGKKRLPHPGTGKNGITCPGCGGSGTYAPDEGDPDDPGDDDPDGYPGDSPGPAAGRRGGRVLGAESMPLEDKALPVHHTGTVDEKWDGPAAVRAMPADDTVLKYCHAWESDEAAAVPHREGDHDADDQKQNYKFPHHKADGGPANVNACNNGLARLSGADIPDGDRAGVEAHLRAHLKDAGHGDGKDAHARDDSGAGALEQIRAALPALRGDRA